MFGSFVRSSFGLDGTGAVKAAGIGRSGTNGEDQVQVNGEDQASCTASRTSDSPTASCRDRAELAKELQHFLDEAPSEALRKRLMSDFPWFSPT